METVNRCTKELLEAICSSQAYEAFEEAKNKISDYPELRKQLQQFRKENYELQNSTSSEEWYEKIRRFEKLHEKFQENPLVRDYLNSELELCRMIQRINHCIVKTVEMEIDEFADAIEV